MEVKNDGLFRQLNGTTAHILIIVGLVLLLGAPLIPSFKNARVARAFTEFNQVDSLLELDMEDLRKQQERERKTDQDEANKDSMSGYDYNASPEENEKRQRENAARAEARQKREDERQKVFEDKQEELKKKYDATARRRALMNAQMAATGMRWHLVLLFLGNVMLLVGLVIVTLESTGATQKVALVILLVAMFSALSGVTLNFLTLGSLGGDEARQSQAIEQLLKESKGSWQP